MVCKRHAEKWNNAITYFWSIEIANKDVLNTNVLLRFSYLNDLFPPLRDLVGSIPVYSIENIFTYLYMK